jgi:hypothetical protein
MPYSIIEEMDDLIDWNSELLRWTDVWINDIDNEINDSHPMIL